MNAGTPAHTAPLLVALYAVGLIVANPMFAFGFFYIAFLAWVLFARYAGRSVGPRDRRIAQALWVAVVVWILALVPAFMFAALLGAILWFAGTMGTICFGSILLARVLRSGSTARKERYRRYGLGAGVAAALVFLVPIVANALVGGLGQLGGGNLAVAELLFDVLFIPDALAIAFFFLAVPSTRAV